MTINGGFSVTCNHCGVSTPPNRVSPESAIGVATSEGWSCGGTKDVDICPECQVGRCDVCGVSPGRPRCPCGGVMVCDTCGCVGSLLEKPVDVEGPAKGSEP